MIHFKLLFIGVFDSGYMLRVYACLTQEHDLGLVVLAGLICLFASFGATSLISRSASASGRARYLWLAATAVVTGSGIWATHFVAMLAFRPNLPIGYDVALTVLSVLIAIGVTGLGFAIGMVADPRRSWAMPAGGAIIAIGIFSMHYTGMAAMHVPALVEYDMALVIASLVIGVVFGIGALRVGRYSGEWGRQLAGAGLLTLAICGLHFTAMGAVSLIPTTLVPLPQEAMPSEWLGVGVALTSLVILAAGLTSSVIDQRFAARSAREAARLRSTIAELEETQGRLEATTVDLEKALEAAAASSQAKSQFLAAMSHELRTPLNAVIGFADVLKDSFYGPLNEKQSECIEDIRSAGAHLLGLVNDVLDLSKMDAGRFDLDREELDISGLITGALAMVSQRAAAAGVALGKEFSADVPGVYADQRRLRQVLLNLLSNAIKFTPSGGRVRVSAFRRGPSTAIAVADTGIGIAPADIPRALERFRQVDDGLARNYEGTGLGLPLSKRLMELHGGTLEIESAVGVGTTVTITFPAEQSAATRQAA
ncbi:MAG: hypothetical protein HY246_11930 [Proteobacteria bacterium]|nr:hypothetical protein [Pseudomonadota bacterium]